MSSDRLEQLSKYLQWRQRGALFANADFRPWKSPDEPAFDWLSFEEVQNVRIFHLLPLASLMHFADS